MAREYKVVQICCGKQALDYLGEVTVEIEVYTLGTGQWRSLGLTFYTIRDPGFLDSSVFVNGHVYWVIFGQIYGFDLDEETFKLLPTPPREPGDDQELKRMLGVLKGRLSLFCGSSLGLTVWVMKGECWYKAIAIREDMDMVFKSPEWKPMFLVDGSEGTSVLVVWPKGTQSMVAYCLKRKKILDISLQGGFFMPMHTFRPSFVKLQNFGSERVHSLYGSDNVSVRKRYRSTLKSKQR